MKPTLQIGDSKSMTVTITEEMAASFGGEMVHPTLSTVSMIYYMEWVGRKVILSVLEEEEEGVGASIEVKHLSPAPIGKQVTFTATIIQLIGNRVVCEVTAEHNRGLVGTGTFTQVILPKQSLSQKIEQMR